MHFIDRVIGALTLRKSTYEELSNHSASIVQAFLIIVGVSFSFNSSADYAAHFGVPSIVWTFLGVVFLWLFVVISNVLTYRSKTDEMEPEVRFLDGFSPVGFASAPMLFSFLSNYIPWPFNYVTLILVPWFVLTLFMSLSQIYQIDILDIAAHRQSIIDRLSLRNSN